MIFSVRFVVSFFLSEIRLSSAMINVVTIFSDLSMLQFPFFSFWIVPDIRRSLRGKGEISASEEGNIYDSVRNYVLVRNSFQRGACCVQKISSLG